MITSNLASSAIIFVTSDIEKTANYYRQVRNIAMR